jgi:hypothetical protein
MRRTCEFRIVQIEPKPAASVGNDGPSLGRITSSMRACTLPKRETFHRSFPPLCTQTTPNAVTSPLGSGTGTTICPGEGSGVGVSLGSAGSDGDGTLAVEDGGDGPSDGSVSEGEDVQAVAVTTTVATTTASARRETPIRG